MRKDEFKRKTERERERQSLTCVTHTRDFLLSRFTFLLLKIPHIITIFGRLSLDLMHKKFRKNYQKLEKIDSII